MYYKNLIEDEKQARLERNGIRLANHRRNCNHSSCSIWEMDWAYDRKKSEL